MEKKEFYGQIAKRISPLTQTTATTDGHMINIVLQNTHVKVEDMANDKAVRMLFNNRGEIIGEAYRFIRDNQNLYVDQNNMDIKQVNRILNQKNIKETLQSTNFNDQDSQLLVTSSPP